MIEKLKAIKEKFDTLTVEIADPNVIADIKTWQAKVKEHSALVPLMEEYDNNEKMRKELEDATSLLEAETDSEMKEMLKEETDSLREKIEESDNKLKLLLLPKDENDDKNDGNSKKN